MVRSPTISDESASASIAGGTTARSWLISATMMIIASGACEIAPNTATIPTKT